MVHSSALLLLRAAFIRSCSRFESRQLSYRHRHTRQPASMCILFFLTENSPLRSTAANRMLHNLWQDVSNDKLKLKLFYNCVNLPLFLSSVHVLLLCPPPTLHLKLGVKWATKGFGMKMRLGSRSNPPENTLHALVRSPRVRRLLKECGPCRRSRSSYVSWRKPLASLIVNRSYSRRKFYSMRARLTTSLATFHHNQ